MKNQPDIHQARRLKASVTKRDQLLQQLKTAENDDRIVELAGQWLDAIDATALIAQEVSAVARTFACQRADR